MERGRTTALVIDTDDYELSLDEDVLEQFLADRSVFIDLMRRIIDELGLTGYVEHLTVSFPAQGRAEIYRDRDYPWPSTRLCLDLYPGRHLDERLLRHEFGHEADRRNPAMGYDPTIETRWKGNNAFEMAANVSL